METTRDKICRSLNQIVANEKNSVAFAQKIGATKQSVNNWLKGRNTPDIEVLATISNVYNIPLSAIFDGDISSLPVQKMDYVEVPLFGKIAAGSPIEMIESDDTFIIPLPLKIKYPRSYLLEVKGESMNKKLPNGSYALINPDAPVVNGRAYAVCVNGFDATIKRVYELDNGYELRPDSTDPTIKPKVYDYGIDGTDEITVLGQVVWYTVPFDFVV